MILKRVCVRSCWEPQLKINWFSLFGYGLNQQEFLRLKNQQLAFENSISSQILWNLSRCYVILQKTYKSEIYNINSSKRLSMTLFSD